MPSKPATSAKRRGRENSTTSSPAKKPRSLGDGHLDSRTVAARKRLGLKPGATDGFPDLTARIKAGVGSIAKAIEVLSEDDSDDSRAFMERYRSVPKSDRSRLKLEDFVAAADITPRRFVELVTGALLQQCQDVTKMMVAVAQPKVIQATIKAATDQVPIIADVDGERIVVGHTNGDTKAMEIFHKATGFLPTPKGSNTTINLNQLNQTANLSDGEGAEESSELQSMDEFLMEMQDVVAPKQLPAPAVEIPTLIQTPELDYIDADV